MRCLDITAGIDSFFQDAVLVPELIRNIYFVFVVLLVFVSVVVVFASFFVGMKICSRSLRFAACFEATDVYKCGRWCEWRLGHG